MTGLQKAFDQAALGIVSGLVIGAVLLLRSFFKR